MPGFWGVNFETGSYYGPRLARNSPCRIRWYSYKNKLAITLLPPALLVLGLQAQATRQAETGLAMLTLELESPAVVGTTAYRALS